MIGEMDCLINPGVPIPPEVSAIHGITDEMVRDARSPKDALREFFALVDQAHSLCGHNTDFDIRMIRIAGFRHFQKEWKNEKATFCTMRASTNICRIPSEKFKAGFKWPKLSEAIRHFFDEELPDAHRTKPDVVAARRIYFELMKRKVAA